MTPLSIASALLAQGVACVPCHHYDHPTDPKAAKVKWQPYQSTLPTPDDLARWFKGDSSLALIAGAVTCLDLDTKHAPLGFLADWHTAVEAAGLAPLLTRLVQQETPSGGRHYLFRCPESVRNLKLAEVMDGTKRQTLIETRGQGGYFLIAPSKAYRLTAGDLAAIPEITVEERDDLFDIARSFNEATKPAKGGLNPASPAGGAMPGEDYATRADIPALLASHGWQQVGQTCYFTRPGKGRGISASWNRNGNGHLVVFTSNAYPFEPSTNYTAFGVFATLEHGGNYAEAARALRKSGFGDKASSHTYQHTQGEEGMPGPEHRPTGRELPAILSWDEEEGMELPRPPELIQGVLYQGAKLLFAGPSKSRKTWALSDLAVSVASGHPWLGWPTLACPVLYLNLELQHFAFRERRQAIQRVKCASYGSIPLFSWNLRGYGVSLAEIHRQTLAFIAQEQVKLVVVDPVYKLATDGAENSAEDVGKLLNAFEMFAREADVAIAMAHHFGKGDKSQSKSIDRASGSGVWARDPDTIITLNPGKDDDDTMTVETTFRNFPGRPPFRVRWDHPVWVRADEDVTAPASAPSEPKSKGRPAKLTAEQLRIVLKGIPGGIVTNRNIAQVAAICGSSNSTVWDRWSQIRESVEKQIVEDNNSLD